MTDEFVQEYITNLPENVNYGTETKGAFTWDYYHETVFYKNRTLTVPHFQTYDDANKEYNQSTDTVRLVKYSRYLASDRPQALEVKRYKNASK